MNIGKRIRYLRILNNLTSKELSKALNISESSISLYENGKRKPTIDIIVKIADYFKVSTDFLLCVAESSHMETFQSETDFSNVLESVITFLNNQNYIFFEGNALDAKTVIFIKKNIYNLLENMKMMADRIRYWHTFNIIEKSINSWYNYTVFIFMH